MNFIDFEKISIGFIILLLIVAAVVVWISGTRLSKLSDQLAKRTGLGRAFIGVLLLGGITSLPEVATTLTASVEGNAGMAISNILGGVSMQVTILAVVDFWVRKQPISTSTSTIVLIMEGSMVIILLALTGVFMLVPGFSIFHFGINSLFIFLLFLFSLFIVHKYSALSWVSYRKSDVDSLIKISDFFKKQQENAEKESQEENDDLISIGTFFKSKGLWFLLLSVLILVAGYFVVKTSERIAEETGIGTSFAGLVLIAITTSLPEISTTIAAVKLKRYDMAVSNIFGTNLFDITLIFLADLFFLKGPVLSELSQFEVVAAFLGIVLTSIYVVGIATRNKKSFLKLGYDSWIILLTYITGILILFNMKG